MASPALASLDDLEARMGSVSDATRAQAAIDDASALIHDATGYAFVDDDGELVADVPAVVRAVCCKAARRSMENPLGLVSQSESISDYTQSLTFSPPSADVYLSAAERDTVRRAAGLGRLGSVKVVTESWAEVASTSDDDIEAEL